LVRRAPIPFNRLVIILRHALAILVTDTKIALRLRVALFGGVVHRFKCLPCAAIGHYSKDNSVETAFRIYHKSNAREFK